jgi:arylsulfatase A-like enzyme
MARTAGPERSNELRQAFIFSACLGLLGGFTEVLIVSIQRAVMHQVVLITPDTAWMAPLTQTLLVLLAAGGLTLIGSWWPRLPVLRVSTFVAAFIAAFGPLLLLGILNRNAALLLAAGLASQISWALTRYATRVDQIASATLGWPRRLAALFHFRPQASAARDVDRSAPLTRRQALLGVSATLVGTAVGLHLWDQVTEVATQLRLPPPAPAAPNVLWIMMDTVRAANMSAYGAPRNTTPQFERLAADGVCFDFALAPASWTLPSHASMFTGYYPHELQADWGIPLDNQPATIAEVLTESGYATAGFVANTYYGNPQYGLGRGFTHYEHFPVTPGQVLLGSALGRELASSQHNREFTQYRDIANRQSAGDVNAELLRWLSLARGGRPFFAFLNYFDAHDPYLPPEPFDTLFGPSRQRAPFKYTPDGQVTFAQPASITPEQAQAEQDAYDGSIAYVDNQIGALLDELQHRGTLDNTLVVITADHGEEFGEHGAFEHGNNLYLTSIHVPLLVLFKDRLPAGKSISDAISLRDLSATILDQIGVKSTPFPTDRSLARYWSSTAPREPEAVVSELTGWNSRLIIFGIPAQPNYPFERNNLDSVLVDDFHYLHDGGDGEELYHYPTDPLERTNLLDAAVGKSALARARELRVQFSQVADSRTKFAQRPES